MQVQKIFKFLWLWTVVFWGFSFSVSAADLVGLRFGQQSNQTARVVVQITEKKPVRLFTLKNPNRVVIDFNETDLKTDVSDTAPRPVLFIQKVRFGQPLPHQTRIVLEVDTLPIFDEGFYLAPMGGERYWRYVLDLKTSSAQKEPDAPSVLLPLTSAIPAPSTTSSVVKKPLIVLDPGHGGKDPGAISQSGRYEKNLTLTMAKETKKILESSGKYRVLLTRDKDVALALRERIAFAHKNKADLFISIHADSAKNKNAKGLSVYTISERASDKEAMALAERENKADIILGIDLSGETQEVSNILIDLAKRDTMEKSSHYANLLVSKMASQVTLVKDAHRYAGFVVLKSPNIPSVLIELGYLSNKQEEKLLAQSAYRNRLSKSILQAVDAYFNSIYE